MALGKRGDGMTQERFTERRGDAATIAAIGVLAAIGVTTAHEALGHGSACLALGGRVTLVTSSLFRCDARSYLIDLWGPLTSLGIGLAAAMASKIVGGERPEAKLFLILVSAFAGFWEGGYLAQAMLTRHGDLYFAWAGLVGEPSGVVRGAGIMAGVAIYLATVAFVARSLSSLARGPEARRTARIAWVSATLATVGAALLYRGGLDGNLRNAFLELSGASLPLLLIPIRQLNGVASAGPIVRSPAIIGVAAVGLLAFTLTIGRGVVG